MKIFFSCSSIQVSYLQLNSPPTKFLEIENDRFFYPGQVVASQGTKVANFGILRERNQCRSGYWIFMYIFGVVIPMPIPMNDDLTLHSAKRRRTDFVSSINWKQNETFKSYMKYHSKPYLRHPIYCKSDSLKLKLDHCTIIPHICQF